MSLISGRMCSTAYFCWLGIKGRAKSIVCIAADSHDVVERDIFKEPFVEKDEG